MVGRRELAFFPGVARGSIYSGFQYESEAGAEAARVQYLDLLAQQAQHAERAQHPQHPQRAAELERADAAAAVGPAAAGAAPGGQLPPWPDSSGGNGSDRSGRSSGSGWRECRDYINGGPGFFALDGRCMLASPLPGVQVLATYPERGGAAAALLCAVGRGRAVLCGTHPELHPSWLEPCLSGAGDASACSDRAQRSEGSGGDGSGDGAAAAELPAGLAVLRGAEARPGSENGNSSQAAAGAADEPGGSNGSARAWGTAEEVRHLWRVHASLVEGQAERWRYWRGLLVAAGLAGWLRPEAAPGAAAGAGAGAGQRSGDELQSCAALPMQ